MVTNIIHSILHTLQQCNGEYERIMWKSVAIETSELIVTSNKQMTTRIVSSSYVTILLAIILIRYLGIFGDVALPTWTFGIDTNLVNIFKITVALL